METRSVIEHGEHDWFEKTEELERLLPKVIKLEEESGLVGTPEIADLSKRISALIGETKILIHNELSTENGIEKLEKMRIAVLKVGQLAAERYINTELGWREFQKEAKAAGFPRVLTKRDKVRGFSKSILKYCEKVKKEIERLETQKGESAQ